MLKIIAAPFRAAIHFEAQKIYGLVLEFFQIIKLMKIIVNPIAISAKLLPPSARSHSKGKGKPSVSSIS